MHPRFRPLLGYVLLCGACLCALPAAWADVPESPSISQLKANAEKGDTKAQNILANAYFHGTGVPKNPQEAVRWWRKAADQGDGEAFSMLGTASYLGIGVPKDSSEAVRWWQKGAEKYDVNAQAQLGFAYLLGDAVPRNFTMAYMWFNLAASNGDPYAGKSRDSVAQSMTADMVQEAQKLGTDWAQAHPKPLPPAPPVDTRPVAINVSQRKPTAEEDAATAEAAQGEKPAEKKAEKK